MLLLTAMPVQFAYFLHDYFGEYQPRSAYWFDPIDFKDVADGLLAGDARVKAPAVYLSRDLDDGSARWLFYLHKQGRPDLWPRTREFDSAHVALNEVQPGSLLVLYANDPIVSTMLGPGRFVVEQSVIHAGGSPSALILRKAL